MKTIALILVLAAVCIADPVPQLKINYDCGGLRTNCKTSLANGGSTDNAEVSYSCKRGAKCSTKTRQNVDNYEYDAPDYKYYYNYKTYDINSNCSRGANCRVNVGGKKKRDLVAAMRSFKK